MTAHFHGTMADHYADRVVALTGTDTSTLDARKSLAYHTRMYNQLRHEMDTDSSLHPAGAVGPDPQAEALTEAEASLREALLSAPKRNLTTEAIRHCLAQPSAHSLRQTVRELKEQAAQAKAGLIKATGIELVEKVEAWGDDGTDVQGFE